MALSVNTHTHTHTHTHIHTHTHTHTHIHTHTHTHTQEDHYNDKTEYPTEKKRRDWALYATYSWLLVLGWEKLAGSCACYGNLKFWKLTVSRNIAYLSHPFRTVTDLEKHARSQWYVNPSKVFSIEYKNERFQIRSKWILLVDDDRDVSPNHNIQNINIQFLQFSLFLLLEKETGRNKRRREVDEKDTDTGRQAVKQMRYTRQRQTETKFQYLNLGHFKLA